MKIESARGAQAPAGPRRSDGAAAPGFAPNMDAAAKVAATAPAAAPHALDALLALQAEGEPGARRARQVRRGGAALDALDALTLALSGAGAPEGLRAMLESARRGMEETGEAGLDGVLREIDIRLAVELAKLDRAPART